MLDLKLGDVVTVWVNQVMYPGVVTHIEGKSISLDSVQYEGLKYVVKKDAITALSIDTNADTLEKLQNVRKVQEERNRAAADEMRKQAEEMAQ